MLIGFFFTIFSGISQNQQSVDSLKSLLQSNSASVERKFLILEGIAKYDPQPEERIKYADKLILLATENSSFKWLYTANMLKGHALRRLGNLEQAVEVYFKSVEAARLIDYQPGIGAAYLSIGDVYTNNADYKKSVAYLNKAIKILRATSDSLSLAGALMNTGYGYYLMNRYDSALLYYKESRVIYEKEDFTLGKAYNLGNAGLVYAKQGKTDLAENKLIEAIKVLSDLEDSYAITEFQIEMASIYQKKKDYQTAEKYLIEALTFATEDGLQERIRDASLKLSELYEISEDYKMAFHYQDQYLTYRDSINNEDVIRKMADLRTEFEVGQKQIEVDLLNQEAKTQRIILWGVIVVLILVFVLAYVLFKLYRLRDRAIKIAKRRRQVITTQRDELEELNKTKDKFFSIISHDIRAPVSNFQGVSQLIKLYVESGDTEELVRISQMMDKSSGELSALLDNLLDWAMSQQGKFPYKPEKYNVTEVCLSNFSMMENLASAKEIQLTNALEEGVFIVADRNSVSTIIRNLLSNAIKFTENEGSVKLSLIVLGEHVEIEISDTGIGIPPQKKETLFGFKGERSRWGTAGEKGVGLGLNLVHEFVHMNGGDIEVESEEGVGTTFTVTLPLERKVD